MWFGVVALPRQHPSLTRRADTIRRSHSWSPAWHRAERRHRAKARNLLQRWPSSGIPSAAVRDAVSRLAGHHGSALPRAAMTWYRQQNQQGRASGQNADRRRPGQNSDDSRDNRRRRRRHGRSDSSPTWEDIRALQQRIEQCTPTQREVSTIPASPTPTCSPTGSVLTPVTPPHNAPTAEALQRRLANLKRLRSEAVDEQDRQYLDRQIDELLAQLRQRKPAHERLREAQERLAQDEERTRRKLEHVARAQDSLAAAQLKLAATQKELDSIQSEIAAARAGLAPSPPSPQQSWQALQSVQAMAAILTQIATQAAANGGSVLLSPDLMQNMSATLNSATAPPASTVDLAAGVAASVDSPMRAAPLGEGVGGVPANTPATETGALAPFNPDRGGRLTARYDPYVEPTPEA